MARKHWFTEADIAAHFWNTYVSRPNRPGWRAEQEVWLSRKMRADLIMRSPRHLHLVEFKITADGLSTRQLADYQHQLEEIQDLPVRAHLVARFFDRTAYGSALLYGFRLWRAVEDPSAPEPLLRFVKEKNIYRNQDQVLEAWRDEDVG